MKKRVGPKTASKVRQPGLEPGGFGFEAFPGDANYRKCRKPLILAGVWRASWSNFLQQVSMRFEGRGKSQEMGGLTMSLTCFRQLDLAPHLKTPGIAAEGGGAGGPSRIGGIPLRPLAFQCVTFY